MMPRTSGTRNFRLDSGDLGYKLRHTDGLKHLATTFSHSSRASTGLNSIKSKTVVDNNTSAMKVIDMTEEDSSSYRYSMQPRDIRIRTGRKKTTSGERERLLEESKLAMPRPMNTMEIGAWVKP